MALWGFCLDGWLEGCGNEQEEVFMGEIASVDVSLTSYFYLSCLQHREAFTDLILRDGV